MVTRRWRRAIPIVVAFALVLLVCAAAYADNYTYKRTASADSLVSSMTLRKTDFPAQLRLSGGRITPDETPDIDSCNGYRPKQRDLVIEGDAESRFRDSTGSIVVESQVQLFRSTTMAAADVARGERMLSPACQAQAAKQEHVKLVAYSVLGRPPCSCEFAISAMLETKTSHPGINLLSIVTGIRKGRLEAMVLTSVGKSTADARSAEIALKAAIGVQGLALKAVLSRLH